MSRSVPTNPWKDSDVEAHWDSVASIYVEENERVRETHDQRFRATVRHLMLQDGMTVLNISSRDGEATDYILEENKSCEVVNGEISAQLMKVATEVRPGITQKKIATYSSLPFEEGAFDRVLSLETLEHVAEPLRFLEELYRVSVPDTILVLTCPPATSEFPYRVYTRFFGGHGEGPHRFPPSKRVKLMFELTGWKLLEHQGTVLFPVGPERFRQWGERLINRFQNTFIPELGIRQIYVCEKQ